MMREVACCSMCGERRGVARWIDNDIKCIQRTARRACNNETNVSLVNTTKLGNINIKLIRVYFNRVWGVCQVKKMRFSYPSATMKSRGMCACISSSDKNCLNDDDVVAHHIAIAYLRSILIIARKKKKSWFGWVAAALSRLLNLEIIDDGFAVIGDYRWIGMCDLFLNYRAFLG